MSPISCGPCIVAGNAPERAGKTAIVLLNLGGPDSPEAVQPFLFNLFNDKAIIGAPQPVRWLIAKLISSRRAPVAREIYSNLGGKSPLLENTVAQADALTSALDDLGEVKCFAAMRYWHPFADEAARAVRDWGADRIVLLPLYPHYSTATTGSSILDWNRAARKAGLTASTKTLCCYPFEPGFIEALAETVAEKLPDAAKHGKPLVLFSAHGLPQKVVDAGDPYQAQIEMTAQAAADLLAARDDLPDHDWKVCYQSRVGPLEWLKPYTEEEIRKAGAEKTPLVVVPVAFVSEHSETLVELDIEYGELAEEAGVPGYYRTPTVSVRPAFIDGLARLVRGAIGQESTLCSGTGERICPKTCGKCVYETKPALGIGRHV
ncbi:MAG: ferrochelatase [Alphaproteobacteria bacterium]